MSDDTPLLSLPLILPSQAQKHVTHNEALRLLDVLVQMAVTDRTRTAPPEVPLEGDRHLVAAGATGDWAGRAGQIAAFWGGAWLYLVPREGWMLRVIDEGVTLAYADGAWVSAATLPDQVGQLGINTPADGVNRLALSSDAVLFTHQGAGHQVKVNKARATDTASLLFQTDYSGRAEIGTAGEDALSFKVSADGQAFVTAIRADGATGRIEMPAGATVSGSITGTAVTQEQADPVAGRLLKNFDHGLGARQGAEVRLVSNLDDPAAPTGFFATDAATAGTFPAGGARAGSGIVTRADGSGFTQMFLDAADDSVWTRRHEAGTGFLPWRRPYSTANVVGPVSHAAGLPTGSVIERGTNANGTFIRFADGTQICTFQRNSSTTGNTAWTFPAAFLELPTPMLQPRVGVCISAVVPAINAISLSFSAYAPDGTRQVALVSLMALGRWF